MARSKKKNKQPRSKHNPRNAKTPRFRETPPSDAQAKFIWRVNRKYLDFDHVDLGWCNCNTEVLLWDVIQELQSYEGLTWQQIREKSRHNHSWEYHYIPKPLRDRLKERQLDYLPELYQLALANVPRIWGYKEINTFYLIWYDPKHEGYKTPAR